MMPFTYNALRARVVFGNGTLRQLPAKLARIGCHRTLVLSTPEQRGTAEMASTLPGAASAGIFGGATMHTPVTVTASAMAEAERHSLAALGMHADDIERAADLAVAKPYPNPAPVTREGIRDLLEAAFHGREPAQQH